MQDKFAAFWEVVGKRFADNKLVVGFDAINEPWPANFYKDFALFYD